MTDWLAWHTGHEDPSSPLSARLRSVQRHLADAIDQAPPGRVSLVSLCAGQGRDVIGVLPRHPAATTSTPSWSRPVPATPIWPAMPP